mmetsp:Transcript_20640/g.33510  ORF Transcript_20640/g.33510 Transcript_20640/m.33510 type:complete len:341 (-) Transcript_20640:119-1141(-)
MRTGVSAPRAVLSLFFLFTLTAAWPQADTIFAATTESDEDSSILSTRHQSHLLQHHHQHPSRPTTAVERRARRRRRRRIKKFIKGAKRTAEVGLSSVALSVLISTCRRSKYFGRKILPKMKKAANAVLLTVFHIGDTVLDTAESTITRLVPPNMRQRFHRCFDRRRRRPSRNDRNKPPPPYREKFSPYSENPSREGRKGDDVIAEASLLKVFWQHTKSTLVESFTKVQKQFHDGSDYVWSHISKIFSNDAFFKELKKEHSPVIVLRRIYEKFPPKNKDHRLSPQAYTTDIFYSRKLQKTLLKRALFHYHPDKNIPTKYGRRWSKTCKKITSLLLGYYKAI